MTAFPPSSKNKSVNIPDTNGATITKGSGGIPASLKVKNAGTKDASFPRRVADPTNTDKSQSVF